MESGSLRSRLFEWLEGVGAALTLLFQALLWIPRAFRRMSGEIRRQLYTSSRGGFPVVLIVSFFSGAVRVMGVKKANVKSSRIVPPGEVPSDRKEYRVKVIILLNGSREDLQKSLSGQFRFLVRSTSVLGGTEIAVERDPDGAPINFSGPNYGSSEPQGLQAVSDWFSENKTALTETIDSIQTASDSLKTISARVENGEGTVGKLINDDELYNEAKSTVKGLSDITGSVSKIKTFVGLDRRYFAGTEHSIHRAYLRVHADRNKFLKVGASVFDLDHPDTDFRFAEGVQEQDDQFLNTIDVQLGRKFYDGRLTFRGGLIEGKPGAGADYDLYLPILKRDLKLTVEGRGAYDDVNDDDLDEELDGSILLRSGVSTSVLQYGRVRVGVSRIGEDEELYLGLGFEYEDEDIRNFFSLLGLAN